MATTKTPKKKSPSPASIISPPSAGKPQKGILSRTDEVTFFNRVGCLCSKCGASLFGPCTADMCYESIGEIRQLKQKSSECIPALCIPLCKTCNNDTYIQEDLLIEFKKCAEQRARLNLGVSHNDHSIVVSGIIIVMIRKLKTMVKRSSDETDDIELLVKQLQFINFGDLHNLMPDVVKEIIFLYYEFVLKIKNCCKQVKEILQHLMFTVQYAIDHHKQEINLLELCKILSEAASSEHCKDASVISLIYSILNLLVPMIKQDRIQEIEKVLGTNLVVNYIKKRKQ